MSFVSYAQNFEDVMLWRALGSVEQGFYIDIGANDPVVDSVSQAFFERGWQGVHVEPTRQFAEKLALMRPGDRVEQLAVGQEEGVLTFFELEGTGLSTASPDIAEHHQKNGFLVNQIDVDVIPLSRILEKYCNRDIHWLKIDVEGFEREVLESWGDSNVRPWILLVESTQPLSKKESFQDWEDLVLSKGYEFAYFDGLNRYYVHASHIELCEFFDVPPNFFDNFVLSSSHYMCKNVVRELKDLEVRLLDAGKHVGYLSQQLGHFEKQSENLEHQLAQSRQELANVYASKSWRLSAPLRKISLIQTHLLVGVDAWVRFRPGSRPRRLAGRLARGFYQFLVVRPGLRDTVFSIIKRYPQLYYFIRSRILNSSPDRIKREDVDSGPGIDFSRVSADLPLSAAAHRKYQELFRDSSKKG